MKSILRSIKLDIAALVLIALTVVFSGCSGKSQASNKLYIFNWTYYTPDSVIEKFEKEYKVDVIYDSFASNEEMFAKLKAGGANYDLCFPSGDYVSIMIKEDLLQKIDHSALKNFGNVAPEVLAKSAFDPGNQYSIPYYMGAAGVAVNKAKVGEYEKSWSIFSRKDLKGKMIMLDDMREVMGDALAFLGYSVNTIVDSEITEAKNLINDTWKPNLLKFDAEAFAKNFAAGEVWVAQGYAESIYAELEESARADVDFFIPVEGGPSYIDSMVILKNSKNKDMALKFIDFIHRPDIYAEFCDEFGFPATANTAARTVKKGIEYYPAEALEPCELKEDVGEYLEKYNSAWQEIKVGK
jgi:spermidine/putrescine transport system substrate-binding protein